MRQGTILAFLKPQNQLEVKSICETQVTVALSEQQCKPLLVEDATLHHCDEQKHHAHAKLQLEPLGHSCLKDPRAAITGIQEVHVDRLRSITTTLFPVRYSDKFFLECLDVEHDDIFAFVALYDSKVVGWIRCRREPLPDVNDVVYSQIYVQALGILAPYRSLGLASALLNAVIESATRQKYAYSSIYAHVWEANKDALEWYAKRNFRQIILQPGYYRRLRPSGAWIVRKELCSGV